MKKIYNLILAAALPLAGVVGFTSCSDSFLDENCRTAQTTQWFTTEEGIQDLADALYGNIRWHFGYEWAYGITLYGCDEFTSAADLTAEPWNNYDSRLQSVDCTTKNGAANNNCPPVSGLWDQMYYGINTANTIIESADKVTDATIRQRCLGEAYFLRGYNFYRLFAQYGGAVLQKTVASGAVRSFDRATEEEMLNQVIEDLEKAYDMLPAVSPRGAGEGWDKYTAAHFLAKALLYRQSERAAAFSANYKKADDLNKAITLCNEVIAAHPLTADYEDLYCTWTGTDCAAESNPEILMACPHSDSNAGRFGNRTYNYFNPQFSNFSGGFVQRGQYIGGMDFQRCRPNEYAYAVFDNVNDSRMWKTFKTIYGYNNYQTPEAMQGVGCPVGAEPELGQEGILFILNKKDDARFITGADGATTFGTLGRGAVNHTFVNPETGKWVPNVAAVYANGKYDMYNHGVSGATSTCNFFCGINKTDDGSRTAEKGDAHRNVTMARTGETYLIKAECQGRLGNYSDAISTVNELRKRAAFKAGEDRAEYHDGSMAFSKAAGGDADNSTADASLGKCKNAAGDKLTNMEAFNLSYIPKNTYYLSTGIAETTASTEAAMQISSLSNLPAEDQWVMDQLGVTAGDNLPCFLNFIMNERTRELLGEWNRWEELARTNLLVARAKAFNPEAAANVSDRHNYRPIPQTFIDALLSEDGFNLSDAKKKEWQNEGW